MKKLMLFILVTSFAISAFAQSNAHSSSEDQNYLEVINDPEKNLTEKSFARLFMSASATICL